MAKTPEQLDAAAAAFDAYIKAQEPGVVRKMSDRTALSGVDVISTGAVSLDYALGVGGLPKGRITELYGPEGSGKSSLAISVCAQAQAAGGYVGYVDAEHALSEPFARALGMQPDRTAIHQPDTGEQALEVMRSMISSGAFDVVVLDSVASLLPMKEAEGEIGDQNVALLARLMSQGMRVLTPVVNKSNCVALFINQIREKPGTLYGNPETTPGGRALKFSASVRLEVRSPAGARLFLPGQKDRPYGQTCNVTVKKNKVGPPYRTASYDLLYESGIAAESSLLPVALDLGVITKQGNTFFDLHGEKMGVGAKQAVAWLNENKDRAMEITDATYKVMRDPESLVAALEAASDIDLDDEQIPA